ncbi:hypothetical protein GCM10009864_11120 [Streptomyces lunalinharesii]|uniref:Uncharacterized protein n=1 Tax=Streptomyces lunalinharesii TaxID=333384 RepID=A0ABP6DTS7_9ACTN
MLSFEYPYSDAEMSRCADGPGSVRTEEWGPRTGSGAAPPTRGGGAVRLPGRHGGSTGEYGGGAALVGSIRGNDPCQGSAHVFPGAAAVRPEDGVERRSLSGGAAGDPSL